MEGRKVKQICSIAPSSPDDYGFILVLCEDGTMWQRYANLHKKEEKWTEVPPILGASHAN